MWWLPTTWFEDLGAAERISMYRISYKDGQDGVRVYHIECDIRRPNGRADTEEFSIHIPEGRWITSQRLKEFIRGQIRRTYPRVA